MQEALHPRNEVDRQYVSRNEGGRDCVDTLIQQVGDHIKNPRGRLISHQKQYRQHKHQQNKNNQKQKW